MLVYQRVITNTGTMWPPTSIPFPSEDSVVCRSNEYHVSQMRKQQELEARPNVPTKPWSQSQEVIPWKYERAGCRMWDINGYHGLEPIIFWEIMDKWRLDIEIHWFLFGKISQHILEPKNHGTQNHPNLNSFFKCPAVVPLFPSRSIWMVETEPKKSWRKMVKHISNTFFFKPDI